MNVTGLSVLLFGLSAGCGLVGLPPGSCAPAGDDEKSEAGEKGGEAGKEDGGEREDEEKEDGEKDDD